ncbi:trypsin alpha-like [Drosophila biarmipes]|uniref:trypsin alpha-like n=1 Tax=Drosophila biarmipes TaxID=125945 RepID=UPI0021CCFAD2|nr:trypsin alpha-like [Drosophila biarmipes]
MFFSCFLLLLATNVLSAGRVPQPEERIIGGDYIKIEQAPWQVSLQIFGQHACGGSIYSKDIIITAAHCRFTSEGVRLGAEIFTVRVGSTLNNIGGRVVQVAAIKSHESFIITGTHNDIAVMRLSEPLEFTNAVQPISWAEENPALGTFAFISGWGAILAEPNFAIHPIKPMLTLSTHLKGVEVQINVGSFAGTTYPIAPDLIHAGYIWQTTCAGDSGGPLVVNQQLVAVVAEGPKYCNGTSIYTSVPYFREWILNAIESIE